MAPGVKSYQVEPPYFGIRELDLGEKINLSDTSQIRRKPTMENDLGDIDRVNEKDRWNGRVDRTRIFR